MDVSILALLEMAINLKEPFEMKMKKEKEITSMIWMKVRRGEEGGKICLIRLNLSLANALLMFRFDNSYLEWIVESFSVNSSFP